MAWPPEIGITGGTAPATAGAAVGWRVNEQAIEMVDVRCGLNEVNVTVQSQYAPAASLRVSVDDGYRSRRASSASAAIPSTS
jgi:hypothetical protein